MQDTSQIWASILLYMALAIALAILTHLWVRHNLKKKIIKPPKNGNA